MSKQGKFFDVPVEFSFEGWRNDLQSLSSMEQTTQWDIGDILLAAEDLCLGEREDWTSREARKFRNEAVRTTKKPWSTLKNYKSISRKFPKHPKDGSPSLRSDTLSYSIHVLAAPFSREDQVKLFEKAEKQGIKTVNDMRTLIQREQKWGGLPRLTKTGKTKPPRVIRVDILMTREEFDECSELAAATGHSPVSTFIKWMATSYWKEHKDELLERLEVHKHKMKVKDAEADEAEEESDRLAGDWEDPDDAMMAVPKPSDK